jgi:hypothetical protein
MNRSVGWSVGVAVLVVFSLGTANATEFKFDFGPKNSEIREGYVNVPPSEFYSSDKTFGWVNPKGRKSPKLFARDENFSSTKGFLKLGAVLRDHVTGGRKFWYSPGFFGFKITLPKGEYVAAAIMGKIIETDGALINRPPYFYAPYNVRVNGKSVFERKKTSLREYLSEFCAASEMDFLPGDSLFDKFVKKYFPIRRFQLKGGENIIEFSSVCPVNALLIYPRSKSAELDKELAKLMSDEQSNLDAQYKEKKPDVKKLPSSLSAKYAEKGMILFNSAAPEITPYTIPKENEAFRPVGEFLPAGERGVLRFGLLPLSDLQKVEIGISDFISKKGGHKIDSSNFKLWISRSAVMPKESVLYSISPYYAFPYEKMDLRKGSARQFFLYVETPNDAAPGDYAGTLTCASGSKKAEYKLFVKILPFKLTKPKSTLGMYAYSPWHTRLRFTSMQSLGRKLFSADSVLALTNELQKKAMLEMRAAGFNTVAEGPGGLLEFDSNGKLKVKAEGMRHWEAFLKIYRDVFGERPIPAYGMGWGGLIQERLTGFWCGNLKEFKKSGISDKAKKLETEAVVKFYQMAKEKSWPEILFYVQDEMNNHGIWGGRLALARAKFFRALSKKVGFRTCASMNGPVEIPEIPWLDIAIPNGSLPINDENVAKIKKAGTEYWIYNIGSTRYTFGYYLTKDNPKGRLQWSFYGCHNYLAQVPCLPSLGSIVYSTMWNSKLIPARRLNVENIRQGIMDYRYCLTLRDLVSKHSGTKNAKLAAAVKKGSALLKMITDGIDSAIGKANTGIWSRRTCQRLRWRLAKAIMEVKNAE